MAEGYESGNRQTRVIGIGCGRSDRQICVWSVCGLLCCECWPDAGDALELVFSSWHELQTRSRSEVDNGPRHEYLVRVGESGDSTRDVNSNARDV